MKRRILLTGGGSGGSVTPLLALAKYLRQQDPELEFLFVGSTTGPEASLCEAANIPFQAVPSGKWRRYWSWKNITDLGNLWRAWQTAQRIVRQWPPDVTISAGSFVAVPVTWAAKRVGSRVVIHQQDVRPGLANKLMVKAADVITVAFEQSLRDFPKNKVQLVGNPVRPEILTGSLDEAKKLFQLQIGVPTLLVIGGGTGSQALNQLISAVAYRLVRHWQIIHIVGQRGGMPELRDERYHQFQFLTWEFPHALAAADIVISRCGLGAITELAATAKPAIFVPLPRTHQLDNAKLINDLKAGLVVPQSELTEERLWSILENVRQDPGSRQQWSSNIRRLAHPNALSELGKIVLHLARR